MNDETRMSDETRMTVAGTDARFVTTLRVRDETIALAPSDATGTWTVRVQAAEAWDAIRATISSSTTVAQLKGAAMAVLLPDVDARDEYVMKLRGFEMRDESQTVQSVGALDGSTFLVLSRRRRPVR